MFTRSGQIASDQREESLDDRNGCQFSRFVERMVIRDRVVFSRIFDWRCRHRVRDRTIGIFITVALQRDNSWVITRLDVIQVGPDRPERSKTRVRPDYLRQEPQPVQPIEDQFIYYAGYTDNASTKSNIQPCANT